VANLSTGGVDGDGFADKKGAVGLESDVAVKIEDVFGAVRNGKGAQRQQQRDHSDQDQAKTHVHPLAELSPC